MKTDRLCNECLRKAAAVVIDKTAANEMHRDEMLHRVNHIINSADAELPPPLTARSVYGTISDMSGNADAYRSEKDHSTHFANHILELIRPELDSFHDPFEAAARLAAAGNIIDYGVDANLDLEHAKQMILRSLTEDIETSNLLTMKQAMLNADSILYILDNCGEAVFDRLLIEPFRHKTTLAVRGYPVLNDVTRRELADSGLDGFCVKTIDTGDNTPGISLKDSSEEFLHALRSVDLIIAKGQGNFETLHGQIERPLICLFRAKCEVVIRILGNVTPMSIQIIPSNLPETISVP